MDSSTGTLHGTKEGTMKGNQESTTKGPKVGTPNWIRTRAPRPHVQIQFHVSHGPKAQQKDIHRTNAQKKQIHAQKMHNSLNAACEKSFLVMHMFLFCQTKVLGKCVLRRSLLVPEFCIAEMTFVTLLSCERLVFANDVLILLTFRKQSRCFQSLHTRMNDQCDPAWIPEGCNHCSNDFTPTVRSFSCSSTFSPANVSRHSSTKKSTKK